MHLYISEKHLILMNIDIQLKLLVVVSDKISMQLHFQFNFFYVCIYHYVHVFDVCFIIWVHLKTKGKKQHFCAIQRLYIYAPKGIKTGIYKVKYARIYIFHAVIPVVKALTFS